MPAIAMPRLSDSMEEGTIVRWLVADGTEVAAGQEIAEIETDKATMTFETEERGVLRIGAPEGATLPVGVPIAHVGDGAAPDAAQRVKASPVARRLAAALSVDLAALAGTGPGGRIVKRDVEAASADGSSHPQPPAPTTPAPARRDGVTVVQPTRLQQTVARRMSDAKATMPDFSASIDVDMDAAVELRAQLQQAAGEGPSPSFNDFVVKAAALALRAHPRANGAYADGRFELFSRVNVGVAVAAEDALLVPTVTDADHRSLGAIAAETRRLASAARGGTLAASDLAGGTFTVSNLGMYGVSAFTAVLNPPQAAILAVGALEQRAVVRQGAVVAGWRMTLTLTCDHRILYGAGAAAFLADIRAALEQPLRLAL